MATWNPVIINNVEGCYLENLGDLGTIDPEGCNNGPFRDLSPLVSINLNYIPCKVTTQSGSKPTYTYYDNRMDSYFLCSTDNYAKNSNLTQVYNINNDVVNMSSTFSGCKKLNYLSNLPSNLENMEGAFYQCTSLTTLPDIPASVKKAGNAFGGCTGLVNPPTFLGTNIDGNRIFKGCTNLTSTPDLSKFSRLDYAFYECINLTTINGNFNPNITSLAQTFYFCTNLTGVVPPIPAGVTNIMQSFTGSKITSYSFSQNNSPVYMGYAFINCKDLVTADVNNATDLDQTFSGCTSLISCTGTINPGCTNMYGTFTGCTSLTTIPEIPVAITNMEYTFSGCTALHGNIIIRSSEVSNITNIFAGTQATKYVYIPYNSTTYNTFIAAGYDENGTKEGVYLRDISTLS